MDVLDVLEDCIQKEEQPCLTPKKKVLLFNVDQLKKESFIDCNLDDNKLRVAAKLVQDMIIERVIGSCLFDKLCDMVCDGSIHCKENQHYKTLIDDWLYPIFIWGVQRELLILNSYQTKQAGTGQLQPDNMLVASINELKELKDEYGKNVDAYVGRAIKFISCNQCFREDICSCGCDWARERALSKKPYNIPFNVSCNDSIRQRVRKNRWFYW